MTRCRAGLNLALLFAAAACGGSDPHAETIARLVPEDATIVVRARSYDELAAALRPVAERGGTGLEIDQSLATALKAIGVAGDANYVDPKRPIAVAFSLPPQGESDRTAILPVKDAEAFNASMSDAAMPEGVTGWMGSLGREACFELDGYVGVSTAGRAPRAEPRDFALGMPDTVLAVRVDFETLLKDYRPLIEQGMAGLRDSMSDPAGQTADFTPMFAWYGERVDSFVRSADELDLGFDARGTEIELSWTFRTLPGSPLAQMAGGDAGPIAELAACVDPTESIVVFGALDLSEMTKSYTQLLQLLLGAYPEPLRESMQAMVSTFEAAGPLLGDAFAASGGFSPDGMRATYALDAKDPQKLVELATQAWSKLATPGGLFDLAGPIVEQRGGVQVTRFRLRLDDERFARIAEQPGVRADEVRAIMDAIYGEHGMRMALAAEGSRVAMVIGGDDEYLDRSLARLKQGGKVEGDLRALLAEIEDASPCIAGRFDVASLLSGIYAMVTPVLGTSPDTLPDMKGKSAPITFHGGARGTEWSGAISFDVAELSALAGR